MGGFISFGGGGASNRNNPGEERTGFTSTGYTPATAGGSANTKSSSWIALGTSTGVAYRGVTVCAGRFVSPAGAGSTFLVDVSFDGGTTTHIPNLFFSHGLDMAQRVWLPLSVTPSGAANDIAVKVSCTTASGVIALGVIGHLNNDSFAPPLFGTMVAETADAATTSVGSTNSTVGTGAGGYAQIDASLSHDASALLPCWGNASAVAENVILRFATGGAGAESLLFTREAARNSVSPTVRTNYGDLWEGPIASGTRLSCAIDGATGGGTMRGGFYIFY